MGRLGRSARVDQWERRRELMGMVILCALALASCAAPWAGGASSHRATPSPMPTGAPSPMPPTATPDPLAHTKLYVATLQYGDDFRDTVLALRASDGVIEWVHPHAGWGAILAGGRVYATAEGAGIVSLDAQTGDLRWRTMLDNLPFVLLPSAVADGLLFVGTAQVNTDPGFSLYALRVSDGTVAWRIGPFAGVYSAPVVTNGVVYYGQRDGRLVARRAKDGALLWRTVPYWGEHEGTFLTIAAGTLYVADEHTYAYAFRPSDGALRWRTRLPQRATFAAPLVSGGTLYFTGQNGGVYALDAATGALRWQKALCANISDGPAIAQGRLFVGCGTYSTGAMYALNAGTGAPLWRVTLPTRPKLAGPSWLAPVASDGAVFVAVNYARLGVWHIFNDSIAYYRLDARDGHIRWRTPIDANPLTAPAIGP